MEMKHPEVQAPGPVLRGDTVSGGVTVSLEAASRRSFQSPAPAAPNGVSVTLPGTHLLSQEGRSLVSASEDPLSTSILPSPQAWPRNSPLLPQQLGQDISSLHFQINYGNIQTDMRRPLFSDSACVPSHCFLFPLAGDYLKPTQISYHFTRIYSASVKNKENLTSHFIGKSVSSKL